MSVENDIETNLKDLYILSKNPINRISKVYELADGTIAEKEFPTDLQEYHKPQSSPTFLTDIDFNSLEAKVYDQFGETMDTNVTFIVEGDGATIQDGKIVENTVSVDTPYTIIAAVGDLSERQERITYAPVTPKPSETEILEAKLKASTDRQDFLEELIAEMAMMVYE